MTSDNSASRRRFLGAFAGGAAAGLVGGVVSGSEGSSADAGVGDADAGFDDVGQ